MWAKGRTRPGPVKKSECRAGCTVCFGTSITVSTSTVEKSSAGKFMSWKLRMSRDAYPAQGDG